MISFYELLFKESIVYDIKQKYPSIKNYIDTEFDSMPSKYLPWAAKQLIKSPDPFTAKEISYLINAFNQLVNQNRIPNKDINAYKSTDDLSNAIAQAASKKTRGDEARARRKARSEMADKTKILRNDDKFLIVLPATWEDSCKFGISPKSAEEAEQPGEGEYWCISNPYSRSAWDTHRRKGGKFLFVTSKQRNVNDPYRLIAIEKWPSGTVQFTDAKNNLIDDEKIPKIFGDETNYIMNIVQSM
jgi:hypothetical protein